MISLKQRSSKWRIEMKDEVWEFESFEDFGKMLSLMLEAKKKYGSVKENY